MHYRKNIAQPIEKNLPIGVYDSGIGGLTVLKHLRSSMPDEHFIYYADFANQPYGAKTPAEIEAFNRMIIQYFTEQKVKMIIIACNTASAFAHTCIAESPIPIYEIIGHGAQSAVQATSNKKIGLLATEATTRIGKYPQAIKSHDHSHEIISQACPEFVPLIERGAHHTEFRLPIKNYVSPLLDNNVDTMIYGCTHYPIIHDLISNYAGHKVRYIDPAISITRRAKRFLAEHHLQADHVMGHTQFIASSRANGEYTVVSADDLIRHKATNFPALAKLF